MHYQLDQPPRSSQVITLAEIQDQGQVRACGPFSYCGNVPAYVRAYECMLYVCMYEGYIVCLGSNPANFKMVRM